MSEDASTATLTPSSFNKDVLVGLIIARRKSAPDRRSWRARDARTLKRNMSAPPRSAVATNAVAAAADTLFPLSSAEAAGCASPDSLWSGAGAGGSVRICPPPCACD